MSVLLAGWGPAWADNVTVNCPDSINVALAGLDKEVQNDVTITGTCVEEVVVEGFKDLSLHGSAILQRPVTTGWPGKSALVVRDSSGFGIAGFTFQGLDPDDYPQPVVQIEHSNGSIYSCTIQGNAGDGLAIGDRSYVTIWGTTIQDNSGQGLNVRGSSSVDASMWSGMDDLVLIAENKNGVSAWDRAVVWLGNVEIRDSLEFGVQSGSSAEVWLGSYDNLVAATDVHGNGAFPYISAISAGGGGWVYLWHTTIHGNEVAGVHAGEGGHIALCCGGPGQVEIVDNDGTGMNAWAGGHIHGWFPALVQGNRGGGIVIQQGSEADLGAELVVQNNGDQSDPDSIGGFFVDNSSALALGNATVADNYGPGVFLRGSSSATFWENVAITNNEGYGVLLELSSSAAFDDAVSASGNRKFDLVCSSGSAAGAPKGSHPAIGKMQCTQWYQLQRLPD